MVGAGFAGTDARGIYLRAMATKRKTQAEPEGPEGKGEAAHEPRSDDQVRAHQSGGEAASGQEAREATTQREEPEPTERPLEQRVQELASQLEEANSRYLRLAADFENFKKRAASAQLETMRYAVATLAERLLPVLDAGESALEHAPEGTDESWLKGIQLTFQKLHEALASVGVEPIEAVGARFDPALHEAISSEESADHPEDTVTAELRRGYKIHDRVLRPSLVKVSRRPA